MQTTGAEARIRAQMTPRRRVPSDHPRLSVGKTYILEAGMKQKKTSLAKTGIQP